MMMDKGAVPIPYIIALVLAIAVIALIGYWFFYVSGDWSGQITETQCTTYAYAYCLDWKATGYMWSDVNNAPSIGSWEDYSGTSGCVALYGIDVEGATRQSTMANCENILG